MLLYEFGVWDFQTNETFKFYLYIVLYQIALFFGYFSGINQKTNKIKTYKFLRVSRLNILFIINLFMLLLNVLRMSGSSAFSIPYLINKFITGIANPSSGYYEKFLVNQSNVFLGSIGTAILSVWGLFSFAVIPLGFYYFKNLKRLGKGLFYSNILLAICSSIVIGTNKRIFDTVLAFVTYLLINKIRSNKKDTSKPKGFYLKIFIIFLVFINVFDFFIGSRAFGTYWDQSFYKLGGLVAVNNNSILFKIFPSSYHGLLASICTYLCQGYFGFSLTIGMSSSLMRGLGSSLYIVDRLDLNYLTLQYKAESMYGWNSRVQWASIYSWIANDVGHIGVIFVMFLIGYLFARLYKECVETPTPVSYVLMNFMVITLFFIPCNFQVLQDLTSIVGLIFFMLLWLLSHILSRQGRLNSGE